MSILDADSVSEPITQLYNTIRVDPLDNFKKYRGGFNVTNKHYWSVNLSPSSFLSLIYNTNYIVNLSSMFCSR